MKLIISAFIALFAVVPVLAAETPQPPPLASELVNPLTVIIVTPWDTGDIGGIDVAKIDDMIPVDDNSYKRIKTYGPSDKAASASSNFAIQREIWGNYYYGCVVRVIEDPKVPIVHIVFEDDPTKNEGDGFSYRANKHDDEVTVVCDRIDRK